MNQNEDALRKTWDHIDLVMKLLASAQVELMQRQFTHDRSKLQSPEWEMFADITHKLESLTYGSAEYEAQRKEMLGNALGHHYQHNRHHPEFFEECPQDPVLERLIKQSIAASTPEVTEYLLRAQAQHQSSVTRMNLFDLLEMLCDWLAATKRHADGDIQKSIEINRDRFNLSPQLVQIIRNTVPWIEDEFASLKTQKDIAYERGLKATHVDGVSLDDLI